MIFGSYPCCDGELTLAMPDRSGTYAREICPHCSTPVWHKFSRIQSQSWTEEVFLRIYEIDDETKQIREKNPAPPLTEEERAARDMIQGLLARAIAADMMGVSSTKDDPDADT